MEMACFRIETDTAAARSNCPRSHPSFDRCHLLPMTQIGFLNLPRAQGYWKEADEDSYFSVCYAATSENGKIASGR